jgi:hypothetical protein
MRYEKTSLSNNWGCHHGIVATLNAVIMIWTVGKGLPYVGKGLP